MLVRHLTSNKDHSLLKTPDDLMSDFMTITITKIAKLTDTRFSPGTGACGSLSNADLRLSQTLMKK